MPSLRAALLTSALGDVPPSVREAFRKLEQHTTDAAQAVNSALVLGDSLQVWTTANAAALKLTVPTDVVPKTFATGVQVAAPSYRRDANGWIDVVGTLNGYTLGNNVLTGLPAPRTTLFIPANATNAHGLFSLDTAGTLKLIQGTVSGNVDVYFSYRAADGAPYVPSCFPLDLPLNLKAVPQFVLVSAVETGAGFDPLSSPSNLAIYGPDAQVVTGTNGARSLRLRNVPGLLPSKTYALTVAAFGGG